MHLPAHRRYSYLLDLAVRAGHPALVVGPTGTGKSVLVAKYLYALPPEEYVPPNIVGFSARTSANMTQVRGPTRTQAQVPCLSVVESGSCSLLATSPRSPPPLPSPPFLQYLIDAKLDRRRKGVFGPPVGKKAIIFVDDLNMPQVCGDLHSCLSNPIWCM